MPATTFASSLRSFWDFDFDAVTAVLPSIYMPSWLTVIGMSASFTVFTLFTGMLESLEWMSQDLGRVFLDITSGSEVSQSTNTLHLP